MVELLLFAPGEKIDAEEFSEVTLVTGFYRDFALPVVDKPRPHARVRLAVRRAGFEAKKPPPVNPLSVRCPDCGAEQWDPCVYHPMGSSAPRVSLHTHSARRIAVGKPAQ